jgi:hypothetical protein
VSLATFASGCGPVDVYGVTDLLDYVPALERAVAPPGTFAATFPAAGTDDMVGYLLDGLAEAQMDGFLMDPRLTFTQDGVVTPDLSPGQAALVTMYAGLRLLRATLLNRVGSTRYKAGPVEYETSTGTSLLVALLKEAQDRRDRLLVRLQTLAGGMSFAMGDLYLLKATGSYGVAIAELPSLGQVYDPMMGG